MTTEDLEPIKLTEWTSCGGCAAKWGGSSLGTLVGQLAQASNDSLLVGLAPFDDAAVYRISDDQALVSTTDFFPPLVDSPGDFGAIAAANACSDVFAMGGRVILALNIAAFPETMPESVIELIFAAAAATVQQAGGVIAGGHTIRSDEPIFGLAVQGIVHPDRIFTKGGAHVGDVLVISKPIGTGIVLAGGEDADKHSAIIGMRTLNSTASLALQALGAATHGVTDVTGYGLFGHSYEMAERSGVAFHLNGSQVPLYAGALSTAQSGTRTGGDPRNREHLRAHVTSTVDEALEALAYDPQTSGGLLAAIDPASVADLDSDLFTVIGDVQEGAPHIFLS